MGTAIRRVVGRPATRPGRPATWQPDDQVLSIRKGESPITLSDAEYRDWQTYFDASLRVNGDARVGEVRRVKPPIRGVRFGDDGRIWVHVSMPSERYDPPPRRRPPGEPVRPVVRWREPAVFDVYEPEGDYVGRLRFPYDLSPLTLYASPVSMRRIETL